MILWTVYCHTHIESGRRYIGLTKMSMMKRWNRHIYSASRSKAQFRNNYRFANAIRKYGNGAFSHEELAQSKTIEDGNATEETIIKQYNTMNPEKGFNIMQGGWSIPSQARKNPWNDPIYRAKHVISNLDPSVRRRKRNAAKRITPSLRKVLNEKLRGRKINPQSIEKLKSFFEKKYEARSSKPVMFECKKHGPCEFRMKKRSNGRSFPTCRECHKEYMRIYNAQRKSAA